MISSLEIFLDPPSPPSPLCQFSALLPRVSTTCSLQFSFPSPFISTILSLLKQKFTLSLISYSFFFHLFLNVGNLILLTCGQSGPMTPKSQCLYNKRVTSDFSFVRKEMFCVLNLKKKKKLLIEEENNKNNEGGCPDLQSWSPCGYKYSQQNEYLFPRVLETHWSSGEKIFFFFF